MAKKGIQVPSSSPEVTMRLQHTDVRTQLCTCKYFDLIEISLKICFPKCSALGETEWKDDEPAALSAR